MTLGRNTRQLSLLALACTLTLISCSDKKDKAAPPTPSRSTSASTLPPSYSSAQIKGGLLSSREIGSDVREIKVAVEALKDRRAPMCSLSDVTLPGKPEIITRQFTNRAKVRGEIKYAQLVARYDSPNDATGAFGSLRDKARSCPSRKRIPAKKIRENFTLFSHDDTWKTNERPVEGWTHLRGLEKQEFARSLSKFNIFHYMYDYAVQGNVVIATLYWERAEPGQPESPISERATELLTKQLRKFG